MSQRTTAEWGAVDLNGLFSSSPLSSSIQFKERRAACNVVYLIQECSFISAQISKSTHSVLRHMSRPWSERFYRGHAHTRTVLHWPHHSSEGTQVHKQTPHWERECAADWIIQEKAKIAVCPNHLERDRVGHRGGKGWEREAEGKWARDTINSTQSEQKSF